VTYCTTSSPGTFSCGPCFFVLPFHTLFLFQSYKHAYTYSDVNKAIGYGAKALGGKAKAKAVFSKWFIVFAENLQTAVKENHIHVSRNKACVSSSRPRPRPRAANLLSQDRGLHGQAKHFGLIAKAKA